MQVRARVLWIAMTAIACEHGASVRPTTGQATQGAGGASAPAGSIDAGPAADPPPPDAAAVVLTPGCHAPGDGARIFPPVDERAAAAVSYRDARGVHTGAFELCDLPDRVVIVDSTSVATKDPTIRRLTGAVIDAPRGRGAETRHAIAAGSQCVDRCNGPGGGFAGCSMDAGCDVRSDAPGARAISLKAERREVGTGASTVGCAPVQHDYLALCATRERLVVMRTTDCQDRAAEDREPWRLRLDVYEQGAPRSDGDTAAPPSFTRNGDFYAPDSRSGVWAYRFPDGGDGAGDFMLVFGVGAAPRASMVVAGATHDCIAWSFAPGEL